MHRYVYTDNTWEYNGINIFYKNTYWKLVYANYSINLLIELCINLMLSIVLPFI